MKDDSNELLNDLLARWHIYTKNYKYASGINSQPMFRECQSNHRQWATLDEISDEDKSSLEKIDAIVWQMCETHRTCLQIQARNLVTGRSVWNSARLPSDPEMRAHLLADARTALIVKLRIDGIL